MDSNSELLQQFQGAMVGVLVGDCFGRKFGHSAGRWEPEDKIQKLVWSRAIVFNDRYWYTQNSQMTVSVGNFLIKKEWKDFALLARRYVKVYDTRDKNANIIYNLGTERNFQDWRNTAFANVYSSAAYENSGTNGSAALISPVALYTLGEENLETLVNLTVNTSGLTHNRREAIVGALFQSLAVRSALLAGASMKNSAQSPLDVLTNFEKDFNAVMEAHGELHDIKLAREQYQGKINIMRQFIEDGSWTVTQVQDKLGNDFRAPESVPTAFFCFLAGFKPIAGIKTENHFLRTLLLALKIGGKAAAIASMASAISGAYLGLDKIPRNLYKTCENCESYLTLGQYLHVAQELNQSKIRTEQAAVESKKQQEATKKTEKKILSYSKVTTASAN